MGENHALPMQPQSQSSAGDLRDGTVVGGQRRGKFNLVSSVTQGEWWVRYLHV